VNRPIPKMYVSPISTRFSRGRSMPEILAILMRPSHWVNPSTLALSLFMLRIRADDPNHAFAANDFASLATTGDGR
jgi:hypothetical protein